jgi:hypothetical protein
MTLDNKGKCGLFWKGYIRIWLGKINWENPLPLNDFDP